MFLGATGRIGRMVRRHWGAAPPADVRLVAQSRRDGPGLMRWDPYDPAVPVQVDVILAFAGIWPRSGDEAARNIDLGRAAVAMARHCGARRVLQPGHPSGAPRGASGRRAVAAAALLAAAEPAATTAQ